MSEEKKAKNSRTQKAQDTKRHIFDAAMRLLQTKLFEDIKVRDIVLEANVSIGTFYKYYTTKRDVFYATYQFADDYFENEVLPKLTQETGAARILAFFESYAYYSVEISRYELARVLYHPDNKNFDRGFAYGIPHALYVQVRAAIDGGELDSALDAEYVTWFMLTATRGLVYNWCTKDAGYDLYKEMSLFAKRLLRAFAPCPE